MVHRQFRGERQFRKNLANRNLIGAILLTLSVPASLLAQDVIVAPSSGGARMIRRGGQPRPQPPQGNKPKPPNEAKPEEGKDKEKKEGEDKKKEEEASDDSVKRPDKPTWVPDPREFDIRPDENGLITLNFRGQSWPAYVEWLASVGGYNLDWQELPKDYLNLTTEKPVTVAEARDLTNRLLLDRGFTSVLKGRILTVAKIAKIDPSLLPRVEDESELVDHPAHDFVKITFQLPDKLKADKAAEDVKPLLSPHAKVQPLLATNRLLVIDAVTNLREVSRLVNTEYAAATSHIVPHEFVLQHARADYVADQVMILLGLDPASRRTPQELQIEQQRLQLYTQMQQKGKDVTKFLRKDGPKVYLAVNHRRNSILANAEPADMKVIEKSIRMLDVPRGGVVGSGLPSSASSAASSGAPYMHKYQLVTLSPQSIVDSLKEIGDLDPRSRLKVESQAKTIFAFATEPDHQKIQAMIDSLDGTGREFEVIWLRRLPADAVAATIHKLMVGDEDEEKNNRRSYFSYYSYRYGNREEEKPNKGFRVDADIENNRLLLWASEAELKEVRKFLAKLGEIPGTSENPSTVRILNPRGDEATRRLLRQIRQAWSSIGNNELRIEGVPDSSGTENTEPTEVNDDKQGRTLEGAKEARVSPSPRRSFDASSNESVPVALAALSEREQLAKLRLAAAPGDGLDIGRDKDQNSASRAALRDSRNSPPPVTITIDEDGRIILTSEDTKALDRLEDLLSQIAPPPKDYKVFYLKYALASIVTINLEEYFEDEGEFDSEENWMRAWYGMDFKKSSSGSGLARRRSIRFIYDIDTNSILVSNASPEQLEIVEALIEVYDKAPSEDSLSARRFKIFKLNYSKADQVAKTIKEVFRDLLSSKDKEFQGQKNDEKQGNNGFRYYRIFGGGDDDDKKPTKVKASFAGALSVGVDEVSNTVIVSAEEEWLPAISQMIEFLDEQARPNEDIQVHKVRARINSKSLQAALARALGAGGSGQAENPEQEKSDEKKEGQPGGPNGGRPGNGGAAVAVE